MAETEGARTFAVAGETYDGFMGRYSKRLAAPFADAAGVTSGLRALDVGCGPGALTTVLMERLGADAVLATDPSPPFVQECSRRHPGVDVRPGRAEELPFDDEVVDVVMAQLVLHFVADPPLAAREMARVVRPHGTIAACLWDAEGGMEMLSAYWAATQSVDARVPDEAAALHFGHPGQMARLFEESGLVDIEEMLVPVTGTYDDFDQLWQGFLAGVGPAGADLVRRPPDERERVREELWRRVGEPVGAFSLDAVARCAVAHRPG